jgi:hypothetical protein
MIIIEIHYPLEFKMDTFENRRKKKDKAREKADRNGSYSSKHVRIVEELKKKKQKDKKH